MDYNTNNYLGQYRDLKPFYKEYVGESVLGPFVNYPDMKNFYLFQVIDLRYQVDHKTPKLQLFEENYGAPKETRLFVTSIGHRQNKLISLENKITSIEVILTVNILWSANPINENS